MRCCAAVLVLGLGPGGAQAFRDRVAVTDDADAHAVARQLAQVLGQRHQHQAHQAGDLFLGALPVLGRERKHGQVLDASVGTRVAPPSPARPRRPCGRRSAASGASWPNGHCRPSRWPHGEDRQVSAFIVHERSGEGEGPQRPVHESQKAAVQPPRLQRQSPGAACHQTAMISASLACTSLSISAMVLSVSFCTRLASGARRLR
jgi:hypothetical protein